MRSAPSRLTTRNGSATKVCASTTAEVEKATGGPATDEGVAAALGVSLQEYHGSLEQLVHVTVGALDIGAESPVLLTNEHSPEEGAARRQAQSRIRAALPKLEARDITLLALYYNEELTYAEIGQVLGVTVSRVCQLHGRAIARLRAEIDARHGEDEE